MAGREGVVPTLFLNNQVINTDSDIAAYILKFLFWNPGRTSNQIEDELVSMRKLAATYAENINTFPQALQEKLSEVLKRYNDHWTAEVTVTNRSDDALTYGLNIRMTDGAGNLLINTGSLMIKDGLLTIRNEIDEEGSYEARSIKNYSDSTAYNILTTAGILTINKTIRDVNNKIEENRNIIFYSEDDSATAPDDLKSAVASKAFESSIDSCVYLRTRLTAAGNLEVHEKLTDEEIEAAQGILATIEDQLNKAQEMQKLVDNNDVEKLAQIFPDVVVNGDLSRLMN